MNTNTNQFRITLNELCRDFHVKHDGGDAEAYAFRNAVVEAAQLLLKLERAK